MSVTIYHNPKCGTSRNTLAMIESSGADVTVIEYLKTPPTRDELVKMLTDMETSPRTILRERGTPYAELGLDDYTLSEDALIDAMIEHPILIQRPIVVAPKGTRLCRPAESVLDIL